MTIAQPVDTAATGGTAFDSDVLSAWRVQGQDIVRTRRAEFDRLMTAAESLIDKGRYAEATAATQVAANYAVLWHTGQFADPRIEQAIRRIGAAALPNRVIAKETSDETTTQRILHIGTELYGIGGHARMVAHWIKSDAGNTHSLALTGQHFPIPQDVVDAVADAGGALHQINSRPGGLLQWAKKLQDVIAQADLVVLHIHNMDVVPLIALAGLENRPRSLMVNHGDHQFWLGPATIDLIVSTRRSGMQLCMDRRGVASERNVLLPLCLKPKVREHPKPDAKALLKLPEDSVVVLTVARAVKFRDIGGVNFIEVLVPVLRANPHLHMIVVGPGTMNAWQDSIAKVPDQVHVIAETTDTQVYLDAADIYLDSFPFVSITSLLEAGLHGLPLVTRSAFGPDCGVMAADSPGLDGALVQTDSVDELRNTMTRIASDTAWRNDLGKRTRDQIMTTNRGTAWQAELARVYETARAVGQNPGTMQPRKGLSDLDMFIPFVFDDRAQEIAGSDTMRVAWATELVLKAAPFGWRLRHLLRMTADRDLRGSPLRALLPAWLSATLRRRLGIALK